MWKSLSKWKHRLTGSCETYPSQCVFVLYSIVQPNDSHILFTCNTQRAVRGAARVYCRLTAGPFLTVSNRKCSSKYRHSAGIWPIEWLDPHRRSNSRWPSGQVCRCDPSFPPAGSFWSMPRPRETTGWLVCPGWWSQTYEEAESPTCEGLLLTEFSGKVSDNSICTWHSPECFSSEGCCRLVEVCNGPSGCSVYQSSAGKVRFQQ